MLCYWEDTVEAIAFSSILYEHEMSFWSHSRFMEISNYFLENLIELNIQLLKLINSLYVLMKYHRYFHKVFNDLVIGT